MARSYWLKALQNYTFGPSTPPNNSSANEGNVGTVLGRILERIQVIYGSGSWYNAPPTTLTAAKTHADDNTGAAHGGMIVQVQDEGTDIARAPKLNFRGSGVVASAGSGVTNIDVSGGGGSGVDHELLSSTHLDVNASDVEAANDVLVRNSGNTQWQADKLTNSHFNAANVNGAAGVPSLRQLGTGANDAAAGNDSRFHAKDHNLISADHDDVDDTVTPGNDYLLQYDTAVSKWIPVPNPLVSVYTYPGLIEGLQLTRDADNTVGVETGAAYIPGLNKVVEVTTRLTRPVTFTSLSSAWTYLYLYESSPGNLALEHSPTEPVIYHGTARHMNGDTSMRYLGALLPNGATTPILRRWQYTPELGLTTWLENTAASPFQVTSTGAATTEASISCASVVPVTSQMAHIYFQNDSTGTLRIGHTNDAITTMGANNQVIHVGVGHQYSTPVPLNSNREYRYVFTTSSTGHIARVQGYYEAR